MLLNVKTSWIYKATRTGKLPCIRLGRHIRFTQAMLGNGSGPVDTVPCGPTCCRHGVRGDQGLCEDESVSGAATTERLSVADLTRAWCGEELTMEQVQARVDAVDLPEDADGLQWRVEGGFRTAHDAIWVGSIGYERHKDHRDFAAHLREAGVLRLIDVRALPISRRRGYAKTALSEALAEAGVEYVHAKPLGNPKPFRDLYKSGQVEEGRERYREHLLDDHRQDLHDLVGLLREKPSALMCVEHDPATCHRTVIVEALVDELEVRLDVAELS